MYIICYNLFFKKWDKDYMSKESLWVATQETSNTSYIQGKLHDWDTKVDEKLFTFFKSFEFFNMYILIIQKIQILKIKWSKLQNTWNVWSINIHKSIFLLFPYVYIHAHMSIKKSPTVFTQRERKEERGF